MNADCSTDSPVMCAVVNRTDSSVVVSGVACDTDIGLLWMLADCNTDTQSLCVTAVYNTRIAAWDETHLEGEGIVPAQDPAPYHF